MASLQSLTEQLPGQLLLHVLIVCWTPGNAGAAAISPGGGEAL
jgi:hypothetical protein